jgi:hypothetical protein
MDGDDRPAPLPTALLALVAWPLLLGFLAKSVTCLRIHLADETRPLAERRAP